jgi:hypothetical protein
MYFPGALDSDIRYLDESGITLCPGWQSDKKLCARNRVTRRYRPEFPFCGLCFFVQNVRGSGVILLLALAPSFAGDVAKRSVLTGILRQHDRTQAAGQHCRR